MNSGKDVLLILSNLAFLIPFSRAVYYRRWTRAAIYFIIVFASGLYHCCDSYSNLCIFEFSTHHNLDFFFAELIIPLSALYLIYFTPGYFWIERWLIILFAIGIFVIQITLPGELYVQAIVSGIALFILVVYWIYFYNHYKRFPYYNWIDFLLFLSFTALSISLFSVQNIWHEGYWAVHSIWHISAAVGQTYLLSTRPITRGWLRYAALDKKIPF